SLVNAIDSIPNWTKNGSFANYNDGNVGIGTTAPQQLLHVVAVTNPAMRVEANNNILDVGVSGNGTHAFLQTTNANGRLTIQPNSGDVSIGTAIPAGRFHVVHSTAGDDVLIIRAEGSDPGTAAAFNNFLVGGDRDRVGLILNNNNAAQRIWSDDAGLIRIKGGSAPANQTDGPVLGDQTSTRASKQDIRSFSDTRELLEKVLSVKLHTFYYKHERRGYGDRAKRKLGFLAEEVDPLFMREFGQSIDQVSLNGLLIGAIQEQQKEINSLRKANERFASLLRHGSDPNRGLRQRRSRARFVNQGTRHGNSVPEEQLMEAASKQERPVTGARQNAPH
ncbi:MAG: tail fiber domain-containing protein, partial [Leptospiraceae bacterium]|nr:tail fiber domain-containing protein [Leptospiraceae bacterium]